MDKSQRSMLTIAQVQSGIGREPAISAWVRIDQKMLDGFAIITGDAAIIHTDPDRASRTRFKGTIAHGLLTLSLLPQMLSNAVPVLEEVRMGVNYGFERVRFVSPVPVESRLRAHIVLVELAEVKPRFFPFVYDVRVEIEESSQPALTARWILGRWT